MYANKRNFEFTAKQFYFWYRNLIIFSTIIINYLENFISSHDIDKLLPITYVSY